MTENDSEVRVSMLLKQSYSLLKTCDLQGAISVLDDALKVVFDSLEVMHSLKCAEFWRERCNRADQIGNPFERGDFILSQWRPFLQFRARQSGNFENADFAFRQFAFAYALIQFRAFACEYGDECESELSLKIGRCHKGLGDYMEAVRNFDTAAKLKKDDAEILSELADVYSLIDETKVARALFREAFFLNPSKIDLDSIESVMIRKLIDRLRESGFKREDLGEWIPVYGVLWNVFTVKRELKPIEFGKLKQSIYQLENDVKEHGDKRQVLVPRLLTRYFWLVDHYLATREEKARIDEVLLKIKLLDVQIYKQYTA